jgi:hypothetical protein
MEVDGEARSTRINPAEVDAVEWLSVGDARRRLTYPRERRVLAESVPGRTRRSEARKLGPSREEPSS